MRMTVAEQQELVDRQWRGREQAAEQKQPGVEGQMSNAFSHPWNLHFIDTSMHTKKSRGVFGRRRGNRKRKSQEQITMNKARTQDLE